jgi:hypothetical protein
MALTDFSTITVSASAPALTQVGFGTLGILAYHTLSNDMSKVYTDLDQVVTDGFETNSAIYKAVQKALSQRPRVDRVKLLRAESPATVTYKLKPEVLDSTEYAITLELEGEAAVEISFTSGISTTAALITAGIKAAIELVNGTGEALDGVTATQADTNTTLVIAAPAGVALWASAWRHDRLEFLDTTADPGYADDIAAVRLVDDDWYGLGLADTNSVAASTAVAAAIETMRKIFATNTSDTLASDLSETGDMNSVFASNSYARSIALYDDDTTGGFSGIAALGNLFPFDPGVGPYAGGVLNGRTLGGVTGDALTPTQHDNLRTKGYSIYINTAGINHVLGGESGGGEWIDFTRFVDWYVTRLQESLAALQFNNRRVPYDARGISLVESVLRAMLSQGLASGGIAPLDADGNAPSVSVPKLSETTQQDRANRILNGAKTAFQYAGAIQKVGVGITITS